MRISQNLKIYYLVILLAASIPVFAQNNTGHIDDTLIIGQPVPDFRLDRMTHFRQPKATLSDFKGRWLFLDFWFTGCVNCIASFPKVNAFQTQFSVQLDWVMVGLNNYSWDKDSRVVERLYEKYRTKLQLTMPSAYDSSLFKRWDIYSMPRILIIDPKGILRYITDGRDLTSEKIQAIINGQDVSLFPAGIDRPDFDPAAINEQSAKDTSLVLQRSALTRWKGERQSALDFDIFIAYPKLFWKEGFTLSMAHLEWLYNLAYFGHYSPGSLDSSYGKILQKPVLHLKDSSLFEYSYKDAAGKGLYTYHLKLPPEQITKEMLMTSLQQDLKRAFGYRVSQEMISVPVWKLILLPGSLRRLKTKGGIPVDRPDVENRFFGFQVRNVSVSRCMELLQGYAYEIDGLVCIDGTGIKGNIDLSIEADMFSRESIIAALRKQGLDLVKDHVMMKGLVITDK